MDKQRIDENIALITEMLSISDEVTSVAKNFINDIQNGYRTYQVRKEKEGLFIGQTTMEYTLWGHKIKVEIDLYEFTNRKVFEEEKSGIDYRNFFNYGTQILTLTAVFLFTRLCKDLCEDAIYHELEHIYQWAMGKKNNPNFKGLMNDVYTLALVNIHYCYSDETVRKIAYIIYYSNPHEQDAFVHQFYKQCQDSYLNYSKKKTNVDKRYNDYCEYVKWLEENYNDPYVQDCLAEYRQFGYTPKNILAYAKQGMQRFYDKMEHVRWLIFLQCGAPLHEKRFDVDRIANRIVEEIKKRDGKE